MVFSQLITLDSGDVYNKSNPNVQGTYSDFRVKFDKAIDIEEASFISLIRASMYYTWPIVSIQNQNNAFSVARANHGESLIGLADGIYDVSSLNSRLFDSLKSLDNTLTLQSDMPVKFIPDVPTSKFIISITDPEYSINLAPDLSQYQITEFNYVSKFWKLLGWGENQEKSFGNAVVIRYAEKIANINFDITSYFIHIDIISQSAINNDTSASSILQFVPNVSSGSLLDLEPNSHIYLPINRQRSIDSIRVWVTDNKNRYIDMQEPLVCTFHITNNLNRLF